MSVRILEAIKKIWIKIGHDRNTAAIVFIIILVIFGSLLFFLVNSNSLKRINGSIFNSGLNHRIIQAPKPTITPTPTPVPLVQGPQVYSIGMTGTPEMYRVWFNTIDPKTNTQIVKLNVRDSSGLVNAVKATVKTEKLSKNYNLSLLQGTGKDGVWTASWKLNDAYNYRFMIIFSAVDNKGTKSSVDFTIR